jgi:hypothetical protein
MNSEVEYEVVYQIWSRVSNMKSGIKDEVVYQIWSRVSKMKSTYALTMSKYTDTHTRKYNAHNDNVKNERAKHRANSKLYHIWNTGSVTHSSIRSFFHSFWKCAKKLTYTYVRLYLGVGSALKKEPCSGIVTFPHCQWHCREAPLHDRLMTPHTPRSIRVK